MLLHVKQNNATPFITAAAALFKTDTKAWTEDF